MPSILIIVETKVPSYKAKRVLKIPPFDSFASETVKLSGGIWVFWCKNVVQIETITINRQIIDLLMSNNGKQMWLAICYLCIPYKYP